MIWQDGVIAVGQLAFIIALVPAVLGPEKPPRSTSLLTAAVLTVFVPTFWTLELYLSAAMNCIAAAMWWMLYIQRSQK